MQIKKLPMLPIAFEKKSSWSGDYRLLVFEIEVLSDFGQLKRGDRFASAFVDYEIGVMNLYKDRVVQLQHADIDSSVEYVSISFELRPIS